MSLIEIKDVYYRYNKENRAVNGVSLNIEKGEYVCILGHNGSGKSTLAKLIAGLLKARRGTIKINDIILSEETIDDLRHMIGIVFQNPDSQFVGVTVIDDMAFGLENRNIEKDKMLELIDEYSKKVSMHNFLDRNPEQLSGGEKQRVAIAGILAMNPELIIFDEATSMLDPQGIREVMEVVKTLKKEKTIISITHNLNEAQLADRVLVMNNGVIVMDGTPEDVFNNVDLLKESNLDILDSMKIIEKINNSNINNKERIINALWELTYQK